VLELSLVAYDKATERLASESRIPAAAAIEALRLAGIDLSKIDGPIGEIPLDPEQAVAIARILAIPAKPSRFDYFLETTTAERARIAR
jgi:hypothetical protein